MAKLNRKLKRMERAKNDSRTEKKRYVKYCTEAISECESWANKLWQAYDGSDEEPAYLWMDFICSNYKKYKKEVNDMCEVSYEAMNEEIKENPLPIGIVYLIQFFYNIYDYSDEDILAEFTIAFTYIFIFPILAGPAYGYEGGPYEEYLQLDGSAPANTWNISLVV